MLLWHAAHRIYHSLHDVGIHGDAGHFPGAADNHHAGPAASGDRGDQFRIDGRQHHHLLQWHRQ
ncbi:hypothetical protein [Chromobacterium phragmitis]|uniref:hypothetical protein n=1 Tax=Chromobacterium phragmitis TaxID=2202141 RepID=UPI003263DD4F